MGNFYTNFTLKTSDTVGVAATLTKASRSALVSPAAGGYVVVFDEAADQQDTEVVEEVGSLLSGHHRCAVLAILNHDDDVLCYWLFAGGKRVDAYNSCPDYWDESADSDRGGDAGKLCETLGVRQFEAAVKRILYDDEYTFALEQHSALVAALRLPEWAVGGGFNYIEKDELPDGLSVNMLLRTP